MLFLDADTLLGEGALDACASLPADGLFVASIKHVPDHYSPTIRLGMKVVYLLIFLSLAFGFPVTNGDFLLTNKHTYDALGGFREGYLLGEDTDFGHRARKAGATSFMIWKFHVVASSRRLGIMPIGVLIWIWAKAYTRVLLKGPTPKKAGINYPFGLWGKAEEELLFLRSRCRSLRMSLGVKIASCASIKHMNTRLKAGFFSSCCENCQPSQKIAAN